MLEFVPRTQADAFLFGGRYDVAPFCHSHYNRRTMAAGENSGLSTSCKLNLKA